MLEIDMKAFEVLTRHVAVTRPDEPLLEAIHKMREEHVGALVVVEEREGVPIPVGMLTDRDIVVGVLAKDVAHVDKLDVGDVMTSDVVTATADEDVGDVLRRMRSFGVRRVPVVDAAGTLEGLVSLDDILAGLSDELAEVASLASRQREREPARRP
jgi:CBS domain-containing protein